MKLKRFIFFAVLLFACSDNRNESSAQTTQEYLGSDHFTKVSQLKLPDELSWCGEKIPLDIPEVKERAEREFYLLLQQPGQIILYLKRSGRYFPLYEQVLREYNMPDDLKYLSVAESALYMALSSKEAMGLWQFMSATAKHLGLQVTDMVDERRHPEKSTRAALKYLRQGFESNGSWMLTAAGYNMGHTNVTKNLKYQNADDYFDLFLNTETSRFIFRIALIKELMSNAEKYGFILDKDDYYKPYDTKIVEWNKSIKDLSAWAIEQGTSYKFVKLYNPWILGRELPSPGKGKWEIAVPND